LPLVNAADALTDPVEIYLGQRLLAASTEVCKSFESVAGRPRCFDHKPQRALDLARRHSLRRPPLARPCRGRQFLGDNPVGDELAEAGAPAGLIDDRAAVPPERRRRGQRVDWGAREPARTPDTADPAQFWMVAKDTEATCNVHRIGHVLVHIASDLSAQSRGGQACYPGTRRRRRKTHCQQGGKLARRHLVNVVQALDRGQPRQLVRLLCRQEEPAVAAFVKAVERPPSGRGRRSGSPRSSATSRHW